MRRRKIWWEVSRMHKANKDLVLAIRNYGRKLSRISQMNSNQLICTRADGCVCWQQFARCGWQVLPSCGISATIFRPETFRERQTFAREKKSNSERLQEMYYTQIWMAWNIEETSTQPHVDTFLCVKCFDKLWTHVRERSARDLHWACVCSVMRVCIRIQQETCPVEWMTGRSVAA